VFLPQPDSPARSPLSGSQERRISFSNRLSLTLSAISEQSVVVDPVEKISRDPDPPPSVAFGLILLAPSPPLMCRSAWAETHSCVQRTFRPSSSAAPASPLAVEPIQHRWDGQRELH